MNRKPGKSKLISILIVIGDFIILNSLFLGFIFYKEHCNCTSLIPVFRQVILALNFAYIPVSIILIEQHKKRIFEIDKMMRLAFYSVSFHFVIFYVLLNFLGIQHFSSKFIIVFFSVLYFLIFSWWVFGRYLLKWYRRQGFNYRNIVFIGTGKSGIFIANKLMQDSSYGFKVLGYFDDNPSVDTGSIPYLGEINNFKSFVLENNVDEVYCALHSEDGQRIVDMLNFSEKNLVKFFIIPSYYTFLRRKVQMHEINSVPVLMLFSDPLEYGLNRIIKRTFDIGFSLFVLVFLFPFLFVLTSIAISLSSPGPIFFRQKRTGLKGEDFECLKFRTMRVNKDSDKLQAVKDDPRKTKVGDFLRKTNIDEIPQFVNVLKGDMSIVGPRPHMLKHTEDYSRLIDTYMIRHFVKPGVTGWAQVNGYRGETKELHQMEKRVEKDVWYIENWSFWLDIKIIVMTVVNIFKGEKNAY
ncbi:MAG: undecaprenyl-phosphate glucose phosphotransferase [Bacteroidales bacterium]